METTIKRIGISGSHSCGKTTLLHKLSNELPNYYPTIEEIASLFPRYARRYMETQVAIMRAQIETEKRFPDMLITDRTVMDNLAYTLLCFSESKMTQEDRMFMMLSRDRCMRHLATHPYDLVIFVDETIPIEDNDSRCLNPYYQTVIYSNLKNIVISMKDEFKNFDILYVKGTVNERIATIIKYLNTK